MQKLRLESDDGKIEIFKPYFDGVIVPHKPKAMTESKVDNLTLETNLMDCGFTFGKKFRDYFIKVTGNGILSLRQIWSIRYKRLRINTILLLCSGICSI